MINPLIPNFGGAAGGFPSGAIPLPVVPLLGLDPAALPPEMLALLQVVMGLLAVPNGGVMAPSANPAFGAAAPMNTGIPGFLGASPASVQSGGGGGGYGGAAGGGATSSSAGGSGASSMGGTSGSADPGLTSGEATPGAFEMLKRAGDMVGLHERGDTAEIQKITGKSGINPATTPWCAAFAMNLLDEHKLVDLDGLSNRNYCPTIESWARGKGIYGTPDRYKPKSGDAILFDWEGGGGTPDHIGLVEKVKNGKVYTIEGNSSDSVKRNVYDVNDPRIDGYVVTKDKAGPKGEKAGAGAAPARKGPAGTRVAGSKSRSAPATRPESGTASKAPAPTKAPAPAKAPAKAPPRTAA